MLVVFVAALALRAPLLGGGQIDYDEGVYWQSLRALAAGHQLFGAVYSSQPPGFLLLLLPAHLGLGGTLVAARLTVLALALAGIAAGGRAVWLLAGPWAGVLAAALLAADPLYFRESVTLQAEAPALALGLVALAAAAEARARNGRAVLPLAAIAGAALAAAVLVKLLAVAAGPAVLVLLVTSRRPVPRLAAAALGGVLVAAAVLLPFASVWPELWRQAVGLHLVARALPLGGIDRTTALRELPIAVLGAAGCLVAVRKAPVLAATGAAWAAAAALLLVAQHPVWPHHATVLAVPLALLGGALATPLTGRVAAVACLAAVVAGLVPAGLVRAQQQPAATDARIAAALAAHTAPGDLVIADDQFAVAQAGRDVPPALVDTSFVRAESGDLTAAQVERVAGDGRVRAVLFATGRLDALPGLRAWVRERFPDAIDVGGRGTLYVRPAIR